jgi:tRNA threonylcarbamoyladenosine biosynthesis protein TsaE
VTGTLVVLSDSPERTREAGKTLGGLLDEGAYICLYGELGAGKTTFVQGIAGGLGVAEQYITSPSFSLINEYKGRLDLYHIDLYRLSGPGDLEGIGFHEYPIKGVAVVEWPERAEGFLPDQRLDILIEYVSDGSRRITFSARGKVYESILEGLCRITRR